MPSCRWRIPREGAMRTDGLVFASAAMMADLHREQAGIGRLVARLKPMAVIKG